ncbi:hypothetical protein RSAG8_13171, partial [Rhizoctonia solani AG-8 WAC10335]
MRAFTIPDDPLLDEAAEATSSDLEREAPEPHVGAQGAEDRDHEGNEGGHPRRSNSHESDEDTDAPNGLFYVPGLVSIKKLRDRSEQELHRFASASQPEREVMAFALNLEIRDTLDTISNAVVTSGVHPDLRKHIKTYTGCLFLSPSLPYYSGSRGGARSKELHKTVLNMLIACQVPNIPPADNHVATKTVLTTIGGDLIDYRSFTKTELAKRKPEVANMDLGTFVANLTRNMNIKVTKEHYGRVAFLSREYRRWESRDKTKAGLANVHLWDWIDAALENARKKYGNQANAVNRFFQSIIDEDERLFNKAVGSVASPEERENWQRQVELASRGLPVIANN